VREPVGAVLAVETFEETQADRAVDFGEEAYGTWEGSLKMGSQLVGQGDAVSDQVLASSTRRPQSHRGRAIGAERLEPSPVGAQCVSKDEGVEAVVLVARRAVAGAEVLQLVGTDDDDSQRGLEQDVDDWTVRPLNSDLDDPELAELANEVAQTSGRVSDSESLNDLASGGDHRDRVVVPSPVHSGSPASPPGSSKGFVWCMLHVSLLAASSSGEAPYPWCRDAAAGSLTVRRSVALSPVDGPRIPGNHRSSRNSCWTSRRRASGAMARWHLGGTGSLGRATGKERVHQ
jgi:hypothetical protein